MGKQTTIHFLSKSELEDIEATNKMAQTAMNAATGKVQVKVRIKAFKFKSAFMEEHFNENYMESPKYPKSGFKGKITNFDQINFSADGSYPAEVSGKLTIHGVTRDIAAKGTIVVKDGKFSVQSAFIVKPEDYNIEIPKLVRDNIAKEIKVSVDCRYEPLTK